MNLAPSALNPALPGAASWRSLALIVLVPLLLTVAGWKFCLPMLNPDSAMGFFTWESRAAGGPWNCYQNVEPSDITRDRNEFLTWWSPGQYELPGLWRTLGFSWGHVILLTTLASCWIEACGCWYLARALGAGACAAAWFCAASILEWHTLFQFGHFRGGDALLGAATPWMLLGAWQVRARPWWFLAGIPVILAGGLYLKLSAILLTAPLLAAVGLANAWELRRRPQILGLWLVAAGLVAAGTWYLIQKDFISRGSSPGAGGGVAGEIFSPIVFSTLSPWLAASGAGNALGRIYFWRGRDIDDLWRTGGWLLMPFALAIWWWVGRWLAKPLSSRQRYALFMIVGGSVVLLSLLFVRGSTIGADDRYMRPTATVLLLALALSVEHADRARRNLAMLALTLIALFGLGSALQRSAALARMPGRGREDIAQQHLSPEAIAKLAEIDAQGVPRSALVYVPWPGIGLELRRQRRLLCDDLTIFRHYHWQGRVPLLIVAVSDAMESDGRAAQVRAEFADYDAREWTSVHVPGWWFWTASSPRPGHET